MHDDVAAIKARYPLAEVIPRYATGEQIKGGRRFWCCPFHAEKTPSFSITPDAMRFVCFGGCPGGDVIDFIQRIEGVSWREAVAILTGGTFTPSRRPVQKIGDAEREAERARMRDLARAIWRASRDATGTPAHTYLRSRGITLPPPPSLRFNQRLKHPYSGLVLPAMVAAVQNVKGELVGVHRTFLRPDGGGKADVENPKLALGPCHGGAVRFGPADAHITVGEGIETALSAQQATGRTAWAGLSSSLLKVMALPFEVAEITILQEGDAAGMEAAASASARWLGEMRRVNIAAAPPGLDHNDLLTGAQ